MTSSVIPRDDQTTTVRVRIGSVVEVAAGVLAATLESQDGQLPSWDAGAHVDVVLPSGTVRQYSLCGPVQDRDRYTIAVLHLPDGRGGSDEFHRVAQPGLELAISPPRNRFALRPAESYLFLAGGIGITPILPMISVAFTTGLAWQLHYGSRTSETMAFRDILAGFPADRVHLHPEDTRGRVDFIDRVASFGPGLIYACGPSGMLEAVAAACAKLGRSEDLVTERFAPTAGVVERGTRSFEVEVAASGKVLVIPPDRSILDVVRQAGIERESSCEEGFCGTCETRVVAGEPEHRDEVLSDEEREANESMMICVSRAQSPRLVLDL